MQQPTIPPELVEVLPAIGSGAIGGYIAGWVARKVMRLVMFFVVAQVGILVTLDELRVITIHYNRLPETGPDDPLPPFPDPGPLQTMPFSAAFIGGFVLGFQGG